jgi:hypothetical protein
MYDVLWYSTCIQMVPLIFHFWDVNYKGITWGEMGIILSRISLVAGGIIQGLSKQSLAPIDPVVSEMKM